MINQYHFRGRRKPFRGPDVAAGLDFDICTLRPLSCYRPYPFIISVLLSPLSLYHLCLAIALIPLPSLSCYRPYPFTISVLLSPLSLYHLCLAIALIPLPSLSCYRPFPLPSLSCYRPRPYTTFPLMSVERFHHFLYAASCRRSNQFDSFVLFDKVFRCSNLFIAQIKMFVFLLHFTSVWRICTHTLLISALMNLTPALVRLTQLRSDQRSLTIHHIIPQSITFFFTMLLFW